MKGLKQTALLAGALIMFFACTKEEFGESGQPVSEMPTLQTRSAQFTDYSVSESDVARYMELAHKDKKYSLKPISRGKGALIYVCNFEKGGYLLLSGDKRTERIIAKDDSGSFDYETVHDGIRFYLEDYMDYIESTKTDKIVENEHTLEWERTLQTADIIKRLSKMRSSGNEKWCVFSVRINERTVAEDIVPHLITTKWGQGSPWNDTFPRDLNDTSTGVSSQKARVVTGCLAVAVSQILYYMHYSINKPTGLYHLISCTGYVYGSDTTTNIGFTRGDYVADSPRWDQMAKNNTDFSRNAVYVSNLMMDIGNRYGMSYSREASGAVMSLSAFSNYDLTYTESSASFTNIENDLRRGKPVMVTAFSNEGKGHAWIIDGMERNKVYNTYRRYFVYTDPAWMTGQSLEGVYDSFDDIRRIYGVQEGTEYVEYQETASSTPYVLMNWGYDGYMDNMRICFDAEAWDGDLQNDNNPIYDSNKSIYYNIH